jgi:hypothetical protein
LYWIWIVAGVNWGFDIRKCSFTWWRVKILWIILILVLFFFKKVLYPNILFLHILHLWNICVTNNQRYVPFVVFTIQSFPHSWHITWFVTRVTRRVSLVEQELVIILTNGIFVTQIFHKCKMCKNKMFGYKTFLKKNKTSIKIIQRIFTRHQVKLHFRMSNPQLTPATIQIQYNYYSKSSFSSTIGILINAMNDLWYYNIIMPPTCIIGTSLSWSYDCWIYVEQELVIILTNGTGTGYHSH